MSTAEQNYDLHVPTSVVVLMTKNTAHLLF